MYHIANDRREYRSAEKLVAAAERILLDAEPQKLTVSLLSREAGVSRTTFYRLFDEPEDVLRYDADSTLYDLVKGYVELIARAEQHGLAVPSPIHWYEEGVQKNVDVVSVLIRMGRGELLKEAHKKALREFAPVLFPDLDPESEEFLFFIELRAGIFLSGVTAWVESGRNASFDTVLRYIRQQIEIFTQD